MAMASLESMRAGSGSGGERLVRVAAVAALIVTGLWAIWGVFVRAIPGPDMNQTGDYLINWSGGIVRRGLTGAIILALPVEGSGLLWVVFVSQAVLLAGLFAGVGVLLLRAGVNAATVALVFSPAVLLFPILSPAEGARKELIGLLAIVLLSLWLAYRGRPWLIAVSAVLFAFGAFAHEVNALLLPAFLTILWLARERRHLSRKAFQVASAVFAGVAASALFFALMTRADTAQSEVICRTLVERGVSSGICGGSITMLSMQPLDALRWVVSWFPEYFLYIPLAVLATLPIYLVSSRRWPWLLLGTLYIAMIPAFMFAVDYGRWIFMVTAATSVVLLASRLPGDAPQHRVIWPYGLAFVLLWSLPGASPVVQQPLLYRILAEPLRLLLPIANSLL